MIRIRSRTRPREIRPAAPLSRHHRLPRLRIGRWSQNRGLKRWGSVRLKYRSPGSAKRPAGTPGCWSSGPALLFLKKWLYLEVKLSICRDGRVIDEKDDNQLF